MFPGHVIPRGHYAGSVDVGRQHGRPLRPTLQTRVARRSAERRQGVVPGRTPGNQRGGGLLRHKTERKYINNAKHVLIGNVN